MSSNNDNNNELPVAATALAVSLIALLATFMQVLQQYMASARGYAQCNKMVIGEWAKTKTRYFSWKELRFEVQFDAPVIYVCPPTNTFHPVPDAPMFILDGTKENIRESWTTLITSPIADYKGKTTKERIHTADNERASWTTLLSVIQQMEHDSREWQRDQYGVDKPRRDAFLRYGIPSEPPDLLTAHTLSIAMQRKRKSWDTMPSNILKPYATTTICHLIEMVAALGVYWKEFDRKRDRYRGEGNGLMVTGEYCTDLGLMFSFQIYGKCHFGGNRVVPVDEIKELCFGWVPTIYRSIHDERRLQKPIDELQNLSSLQLASLSEIGETLVMIGCNANTVNYFLDGRSRTGHLFSVAFEILGMLGQTFHVRNSYFTYIPNPTPNRWDKRSFSLVKMLESFRGFMIEQSSRDERLLRPRNMVIVNRVISHIEKVLRHLEQVLLQEVYSAEKATEVERSNATEVAKAERLIYLNALQTAIDDTDEILTGRNKLLKPEETVPNGKPADTKVDDKTKSASGPDRETDEQRQRREDVQNVLRLHIQEVMRLLNYDPDDRKADTQSLNVPDPEYGRERGYSPGRASKHFEQRGFEDMDSASPDDRQHHMMEVYFRDVMPQVVKMATRSVNRRASIVSIPRVVRRRSSGRTQNSQRSPASEAPGTPSLTVNTGRTTALPGGIAGLQHEELAPDQRPEGQQDASSTAEKPTLAEEEVGPEDIWYTLIFRMICWLMLHDFNKLDVQLDKSELLGNRMPVYIS